MTETKRLLGQELLDSIQSPEGQLKNKCDQCMDAGYIKVWKDGRPPTPAFTDFYEAILDARKENGEYQPPNTSTPWYETLSEQDSELYDAIEERCPEFESYDGEDCQAFMDELSEIGITTSSQFEDAMEYQTDSSHPGAEFAEQIAENYGCTTLIDMPWIVIDWEASWERNLSYDYSTIEFDGTTYFFNNNF